MNIQNSLRVNGNAVIADADDDDSPLMGLEFYNEAGRLSDDARLRIAAATRGAMVREFCAAGIIMPTPEPVQDWEHFFQVPEHLPAERDGTVIVLFKSGGKELAIYNTVMEVWTCASYDSPFYKYGQRIENVVAWRYKASK